MAKVVVVTMVLLTTTMTTMKSVMVAAQTVGCDLVVNGTADYDCASLSMRIAARAGDVGYVQMMLNFGTPVDSADVNGYTSLMWASYFGRNDVVGTLIKAGADVNHQNNYNDTSLLLASAGPEAETNALSNVTNLLLSNNADPDIANEKGYTPLMFAASKNKGDMLDALINANADITKRNYLGNTALILAGQSGSSKVINKLLDNGALLNETNDSGFTALMWAARFGNIEAVVFLLDTDSDINQQNTFGDTSLMWASVGGHQDVIALLLNHGADTEITTYDNFTALMGAAIQGNIEAITTLIEAGADPYKENSNGFTALTLAIQGSQPDVIKILVDSNSINQQNSAGTTSLHMVVGTNNSDILVVLLESCPDYTIEDNNNNTALDVAKLLNYDLIIEILNDYTNASCRKLGRQFAVGEVTYQNCEKLVCHCTGRWRLVSGYDPNCGGRLGQFLVKQRYLS